MKLHFSTGSTGSSSLVRWLRVSFACALLALVAACGARVDLMGSIPEDEANDVLSALLKADIPAEKIAGKEGMVGVRVDAAQVGRALEILRENGLPRERFAGMGQVFKKEGLISSPLEERARYIYALSQELSNTLSKIDGVLAARVHVVLPERGPAGETGVLSTSAVFIKHQEGYNLDVIQPQIRRLVTNSIPGLTADRVSVIFVSAQPRTNGVRAEAGAGAGSTVWGMAVPSSSAGTLGGVLWGLLAVAVLSLAALGFLLWRYVLPARKAAARGDGLARAA
ncbi:type III secretion system inner membrane ring lipoprotein SctJ [Acidovorax sp. Leaf78]|uniref:type III secretion system inner membrane ring lipoprotein SctJ n=1 Tax=unclassified Acidovorax TaxID=2684926 RepID=UPI0006FF80F1|nr:type III secretion inner membrane ring lipoprotein SctJ [Acidovorax sp. Leaf78]KQO24498.1 type III secretion system protein [Acidovorax sp. Leaf78]